MKKEILNQYRVKQGKWATKDNDDFGLFFIKYPKHKNLLKVICAPMNEEWQHVSVSLKKRVPTWEEMNFIKDLFWKEDDCVVQFHPPKEDYVNNCEYCLHLWRWTKETFPRPPKHLVGI